MLLVTILYMLLASTFVFTKLALLYVQPITLIGVRMTLGGLLLLGYLFFRKRDYLTIQMRHAWLFGQIILFHIYLSYLLGVWSMQYLTATKASLLYTFMPFITAVLACFLLAEKMTTKKLIGLILGLLGFLPLLCESEEAIITCMSFFSIPEMVYIVSVISAAYGWIVMKKLVTGHGYSPVLVNGIGMLGGGILAFVCAFFLESSPFHFSGGDTYDLFAFISYVLALVFIGNIIGYNLYGFLLKRYSTTFLSFASFLLPIFTALFGFLFLRETISWSFFVTLTLVVAGLYMFYSEERKESAKQSF